MREKRFKLVLFPMPHVQASRVPRPVSERQSGRLQNRPDLFNQPGHIVEQLRFFLVALGHRDGICGVHKAPRELAERFGANRTVSFRGERRQIHFVEFNAEGAIENFRAEIASRLVHIRSADHADVMRKIEGPQGCIGVFLTSSRLRQVDRQGVRDDCAAGPVPRLDDAQEVAEVMLHGREVHFIEQHE